MKHPEDRWFQEELQEYLDLTESEGSRVHRYAAPLGDLIHGYFKEASKPWWKRLFTKNRIQFYIDALNEKEIQWHVRIK
jgi:hypothetical protein